MLTALSTPAGPFCEWLPEAGRYAAVWTATLPCDPDGTRLIGCVTRVVDPAGINPPWYRPRVWRLAADGLTVAAIECRTADGVTYLTGSLGEALRGNRFRDAASAARAANDFAAEELRRAELARFMAICGGAG